MVVLRNREPLYRTGFYRNSNLNIKDATQKSARVVSPWVSRGICIELVPREPIFEKMFSSSIKRGGADAQNTRWVCAVPYSTAMLNLVLV